MENHYKICAPNLKFSIVQELGLTNLINLNMIYKYSIIGKGNEEEEYIKGISAEKTAHGLKGSLRKA